MPSSLSTEYVRSQVIASELGLAVDPTTFPIQVAFVGDGEPVEADWSPGSWETIGGRYYARALVGPGGDVQLVNGRYAMWVRITAAPEKPVIRAGGVYIT